MKQTIFAALVAMTTMTGCADNESTIIRECVKEFVGAYGPYKDAQNRQQAVSEAYITCMKASKGT